MVIGTLLPHAKIKSDRYNNEFVSQCLSLSRDSFRLLSDLRNVGTQSAAAYKKSTLDAALPNQPLINQFIQAKWM